MDIPPEKMTCEEIVDELILLLKPPEVVKASVRERWASRPKAILVVALMNWRKGKFYKNSMQFNGRKK